MNKYSLNETLTSSNAGDVNNQAYTKPLNKNQIDILYSFDKLFTQFQTLNKDDSVDLSSVLSRLDSMEEDLMEYNWNSVSQVIDFFSRTKSLIMDETEGVATLTIQSVGENKVVLGYNPYPLSEEYKKIEVDDADISSFTHERKQVYHSEYTFGFTVISIANTSENEGFGLYVNTEAQNINTLTQFEASLGFFRKFLYRKLF